jgi:hypothetical protein
MQINIAQYFRPHAIADTNIFEANHPADTLLLQVLLRAVAKMPRARGVVQGDGPAEGLLGEFESNRIPVLSNKDRADPPPPRSPSRPHHPYSFASRILLLPAIKV